MEQLGDSNTPTPPAMNAIAKEKVRPYERISQRARNACVLLEKAEPKVSPTPICGTKRLLGIL